jgi:alpha-tubulin suppressor-like RCC1 family protein
MRRKNGEQFRKTSAIAVLGIVSLLSVRASADPPLPTMSMGANASCALTSTASLTCWGDNCDGELGVTTPQGTACMQSSPGRVNVSAVGQVRSVALGRASSYTCAIKASDGSAWCWGYGTVGNAELPSPRQVSGISDVRQISAGWGHACAVLADSTLWCWGENGVGELGDGTLNERGFAAQATVAGGAVVSVGCGDGFTCVVHTNGTLSCWGNNDSGQLGDGTTQTRSAAAQVTIGSSVAAVDAGFHHVCARLTDGTVRCWGANDSGQLGNGYTTNSPVPVAPLAPNGSFIQISAGTHHTCAVRSDRSLWCWGNNEFGQLGDGTTSASLVPEQVLPLANNVLEV